MEERQHVQHYRTENTNEPLADNLLDGEIAVGMNPDRSSLFFKRTDGSIAEIVDKDKIIEIEKVVSESLNDLNDRVLGIENGTGTDGNLEPRVETLENTVGDINTILENVLYTL